MAQSVEDVTCIRCGCVCDDLIAHVENNQITRVERGCAKAENWLLGNGPDDSSEALLAGKNATLAEAVDEAAQLLASSRAPLVLGPSEGSVDSHRAAIELAEAIGGSFDPSSSALHHAATVAMQQVGISTATLGEIKNRADLVVFWRSDPVSTHPRFVERFIESSGTFVPEGRNGRRVIAIDSQLTATAELADEFFELEQTADLDLISQLQSAVLGKPYANESTEGTSKRIAEQLAKSLMESRYAVILIGANFAAGQVPSAATEALFTLIAKLNSQIRCVAVAMGGPNSDEVLTWQTGYPLAVDFAKGYPRYNAEEFSAARLLSCGEVDTVVAVGSEARTALGEASRQLLSELPVISIGPLHQASGADQVSIATGIDGIHFGGSIFRMDDVALPLTTILTTPLPSQASVLRQLKEAYQS